MSPRHLGDAAFGIGGAYALLQTAAFHDCAWKLATLVIGGAAGGAVKWFLDKAWAGFVAWRQTPAVVTVSTQEKKP